MNQEFNQLEPTPVKSQRLFFPFSESEPTDHLDFLP